MKLSIIYSSRSGNTKRLAEGINKKTKDSSIINIYEYEKSISETNDVNLICCWIDKAKPDGLTMEKIEDYQGKKVVVMATLGAYTTSEHGKDCINNIEELYNESELLGVKLIQGCVNTEMVEMFKNLPEDHVHALSEEKLKRYEAISGCPREDDIEDAYVWLVDILEATNA